LGTVSIVCGEGASGLLAPRQTVSVDGDAAADLAGAGITPGASTTVPATAVNIQCAADMERNLFEFVDHVEATYRVRAPEEVEVPF
jgi:hypothetical protein